MTVPTSRHLQVLDCVVSFGFQMIFIPTMRLTLFSGYTVAQIRLIFHPIWNSETPHAPTYLLYAQRFDTIPQLTITPPTRAAVPDPVTGLYILKRALRTDQSRIGGIIPLSHCRMPINLVPRFGAAADTQLTSKSSMERCREFFLNAYFDKDIFQYLRNSRS